MFNFQIEIDGVNHDVRVGPRAIRKWEKKSGKSIANLTTSDLADTYMLAHIAAVQAGIFEGSLDEFEEVADFEVPEAEEDPKATQREA